jgi:hypothetical protein
VHYNGIFYFVLFLVPLVTQLGNVLAMLVLFHLFISLVLSFNHLSLVVDVLKPLDLCGPLPGLFDLLPGLHFFLLQKCNTVCEQLSVSLGPR